MKVLVILEAIFYKTPDGQIWSDGVYGTNFFVRYLEQFTHVHVAARIQACDQCPSTYHKISRPDISFASLPSYHGFWGYFKKRHEIKKAFITALKNSDAVIIRAPSPLAGRFMGILHQYRRPHALEIVGDPWDSFAPGAQHIPFQAWFRFQFRRELAKQCKSAIAVAYVTKYLLQKRYPAALNAPTFSYSSVEINDDALGEPRIFSTHTQPRKIISIGTMTQIYKGHDILLHAIAVCKNNNVILQLTLIGDGRERDALMRLADELAIRNQVNFLGHITDPIEIRRQLDNNDLFVLASRCEGLPRAIIEAMARGLPCIGTRVGGIPELIPDIALVPSNNVTALSETICQRLSDITWLNAISKENIEIARTYHRDILQQERNAFYEAVKRANITR